MRNDTRKIGAWFAYLGALVRLNSRTIVARPALTLLSVGMMIGNNFILFAIWVIYFNKFSSIQDWTLPDMSMVLGVMAWAVGLTFVLFGGVRDLARTIVNGGLDVHLGRPRHPLPGLLISRSIPSGIGDMLSALLFWLWLGERSWAELPILIVVSTAAAIVFTATLTATQCLVFWFPRAISACEDVFNMVVMVAFYPQHSYGFFVRLILFTVFPTAFISLVPAQSVRDGNHWLIVAMLGAAVFYSGVAVAIFNRGLRLYSSGNRILELR
ncbi:MAG TPA: ABC-2 family transporter protein [Steroidobacteraceae bacterium]|nr:ABC-2 family transporter protein [Steroidobacteraceae bacterium]